MENTNNKLKRKKVFKRVFIIVLALWLGKTFITQGITMKNLKAQKKNEEENIAILERKVDELNNEIKNKDSLEFIEKAAREDHFMVKPREIIFINKNKNDNKDNFWLQESSKPIDKD